MEKCDQTLNLKDKFVWVWNWFYGERCLVVGYGGRERETKTFTLFRIILGSR